MVSKHPYFTSAFPPASSIFCFGRRGECGGIHGQLLGQLAVAKNFDAVKCLFQTDQQQELPWYLQPRRPQSDSKSAYIDRSDTCVAKMLLKPLFGTRLCSGIWPPSKPGRTPPPERAFWPLWPLPAVLPLPEPCTSTFAEDVFVGTGRRRKFVQFHYARTSLSYASVTSTRWEIFCDLALWWPRYRAG